MSNLYLYKMTSRPKWTRCWANIFSRNAETVARVQR